MKEQPNYQKSQSEVDPGRSVSHEPHILHTLAERIDPLHTALVMIDMQKDFCLEGFGAHAAGRDISAARAIVPAVKRLLTCARSAGVCVAHVGFLTLANHGSDSGPWLAQRRRSTFSAETLCMEATAGAEFIEELTPAEGEWVIHKHRYSAFTGTDLKLLLQSRGIRTLVITGVSTNACVDSTMRAALDLDYYVCVPPDAVGSWSKSLHDATLENVDHRIGITPSVEEIATVWND